jgi:CRP/FNR family transcriptional regulator
MLCQGQAKLSTTSHDEKSFILRIANAGEVIGADAVVSGMPFAFTAETMQLSRLNFVSREDFLNFLKGHGDAALRATQHLGRDCHDAYEVVRSIGLSHSASGRVARLLLAAATDGHLKKGVVHAQLALTHEEIGQLVGTSRETITRTLAEFRRKDIAHLKGAILTIHNRSALERLVAA